MPYSRFAKLKGIFFVVLGISVIVLYVSLKNYVTRSHWGSHFGNFNKIEVYDNKVIHPNQLSIVLVSEYGEPELIYDKGEAQEIPEYYGPNRWCMVYADTLYAQTGHWKLNRNHDHTYHLNFWKEGDQIGVVVEMEGEDAETDSVIFEPQCLGIHCCE